MRIGFIWFLLIPTGLWANPAQQDVLYCFDFGGAYQTVAPGFTAVSRAYHSSHYLWIDNVTEITRLGDDDPLYRDFVEHERGTFLMGLDNGSYDITLLFNDSQACHGPFRIQIESIHLGPISIPQDTLISINTLVMVEDQQLEITFLAESGASFFVNGLIVRGDPGHASRSMFADAPLCTLPTRQTVLKTGNTNPRERLYNLCEWYLDHRLDNGFLGDFEPKDSLPHYWWYTTAYPIRALIAGYQIFGKERYLTAVTTLLDKLVSEQFDNGAWQQTYRGIPTRQLTASQIDSIQTHHWMNMADIGSIATALGVAAAVVDAPRDSIYLHSLKSFCHNWAIQWQLPSGGFTNGMESGVPQRDIYSVATAIEAGVFASLYTLTGNRDDIRIAERAIGFIVDNWNKDGRPRIYAHRTEQVEPIYDQPVTHFGAGFYLVDGLLWVYHQTNNTALKDNIHKVLKVYIHGERGLLNTMADRPWFPLQDIWNNSKTAGIPLALLVYNRQTPDPAVEHALAVMKRFLTTPAFARRIGVMVDDGDLPWGRHTLQTWSGCSVAASGFAGLSLAEWVEPGIIYNDYTERTRE